MSDYAIRIDNLSKAYGLPFDLSPSALFLSRDERQQKKAKQPLALKNISLTISPGELVGVIGRNGAGKSTLLKILAGVSPPTRGTCDVRGRIFPMIELNAGMNPTLTGRQNVTLLGTILGLKPADIRRRMKEIEEFCELGDWFDKPVRQYSSGMPGRLGFAVAAYSDADVLLIDEVLAVGDLAFRAKCMERMEMLRIQGKTAVLVSHNMSAITGLSTRTIMLELGEIKYDSLPELAVKHYTDFVSGMANRKKKRVVERLEFKCAEGFNVFGVAYVNSLGKIVDEVDVGREFSIVVDCALPLNFAAGLLEFTFLSDNGTPVVHRKVEVLTEGEPEYRRITVAFPNGCMMCSGGYTLKMSLLSGTQGQQLITLEAPLLVYNKTIGEGVVIAPTRVSVSSPTIVEQVVPPLRDALATILKPHTGSTHDASSPSAPPA